MRIIYKYELDNPNIKFETFSNPKILSVGVSGTGLCVWVEQDYEGKGEVRIATLATGQPFLQEDLEEFQFIGTTIMPNWLVWHTYGATR